MRTNRAATIIDLIAIVAVLALVFLVVLPMFSANTRGGGYRASCMNNVRQVGLAMFQYAGDHDDHFMPIPTGSGDCATDYAGTALPPGAYSRTAFAVLLHDGYLTTTKVFVCPSSSEKIDPYFPTDYKNTLLAALASRMTDRNCSYGWDPTKPHSVDASCAIVADKPPVTMSVANMGTPSNNSSNHKGEGQNVFYNDGHVKWGTLPIPDSGDDKDIYVGGPGYEKSMTDAKIVR